MDIKELTEKLQAILDENFVMNEMAMEQDEADTIEEFIDNVKERYDNKDYVRTYFLDGTLRIPSDTIKHDEKHHLKYEDWNNFLQNYDIEKDRIKFGKKPRYSGKVSICKLVLDKCYCYIVEEFENKDSLLTTLFYAKEKAIDDWIAKTK